MNRKFISIALAMVMVLSLASCGTKKEANNPSSENPGNVDVENPSNTPDVDIDTPSIDGEEGNNVNYLPIDLEGDPIDITNEAVIYSNEGVKVIAKNVDYENSSFGPEIPVVIENNYGQNVTVRGSYAVVNGSMINCIWATDVKNGETAEDVISLYGTDMELAGMDKVGTLDIEIQVLDENYYDYITPQIVHLKTSDVDIAESPDNSDGDVLFDEDGFKMVVKGLTEFDSQWGPGIVVYLENNYTENATFGIDKASLNGEPVELVLNRSVANGKHGVDVLTFYPDDLAEKSISSRDDIHEVEVTFVIYGDIGSDLSLITDTYTISF